MKNTEKTIFNRLVETPTGCLEWTGSKNNYGYGQVGWGGKKHLVHRVVYELVNGEIPEGHEIAHACNNPACSEITHLRARTHRLNILQSVNSGRWRASHNKNQFGEFGKGQPLPLKEKL